MNDNKPAIKFVNKILKAKVTPVIKGELMEESRYSTHIKMKKLIKIFEENKKLSFKEGMDIYFSDNKKN